MATVTLSAAPYRRARPGLMIVAGALVVAGAVLGWLVHRRGRFWPCRPGWR